MGQDLELQIRLSLPGEQIINHLKIHHQSLQDRVEAGIKLAMDELCQDDAIEKLVAEQVKATLRSNVHSAITSWEVQNAIRKSIGDKIQDKLAEYADQVGEKLSQALQQK